MNHPPSSHNPRRPPLSTGKKLGFAVATCLLLVVVAEVACRAGFGWDRDWRDPHRAHPTLGWSLREGWEGSCGWTGGWSRINPQGIRDDDPVGPTRPGEKRLLVVGDSITFGAGVSTRQAFPARLQEELAQGTAGWRVLNGGVTAYDPSQEADWLELYGWSLQPDTLAIAFCRNDVGPSCRFRPGAHQPVGWCNGWIADHFLTAYRFHNLMGKARKGLGLDPATAPGGDRKEMCLAGWPLVEQSYRRIARGARDRGIPVVLFVYPTLDLLTNQADDDLTERCEALGKELGWTVIDLTPAFAVEDPAALFLPGDPIHPNKEGYQRAARFAGEKVRNALAG